MPPLSSASLPVFGSLERGSLSFSSRNTRRGSPSPADDPRVSAGGGGVDERVGGGGDGVVACVDAIALWCPIFCEEWMLRGNDVGLSYVAREYALLLGTGSKLRLSTRFNCGKKKKPSLIINK